MAIRNTIKLKKYVDIIEELPRAGTDIKPGMLVELNSDGKVEPHDDEDENVLPMFALEDELQGGTIDDDYDTEDEPVQVWVPQRGEIVWALIDEGADPNVGDFVSSNGAGRVKIFTNFADDTTVYPTAIVGQVIESKDTDGEEHRVKIRII